MLVVTSCSSTKTPLRFSRFLVSGLALFFCLLVCGAPADAADIPEAQIENRQCLGCHGQSAIGTWGPADRLKTLGGPRVIPPNAPEVRPDLYVTANSLRFSIHPNVACVSCHADAKDLPHKPKLKNPTCDGTGCHGKETGAYIQGAHAMAAARNDPNAPTCATCHGGHDILPKDNKNSKIYPLNVVKICASCHEKHAGKTPAGLNNTVEVGNYLDSAHGKGLFKSGLPVVATCAKCHGSHDVRPSRDPASRVHRSNVPDTCGQKDCHVGVIDQYAKSVHGELLAQGNSKAPVCSDCHTAHAISRVDTPHFNKDIVAECGYCHDKPRPGSREKASLYETYRASYHGQVTELAGGGTRAARCFDCHDYHNVKRINDPTSPLNEKNKLATCQKCHPGAGPKFASFAPHADFRNSERYPILHYIFLYFVVMMTGSFGFFGLHSILWALRSWVDRIKHGAHPRPDYSKGAIQRFNKVDRLNHALVIISFFGLAITGLPLLYSDKAWAQQLAALLGGVKSCGNLHRVFAVMLILNFVIHGVGVYRRFKKHGVKKMLFGPTTMMPTKKDAMDCLAMFKWFFFLGEKPKFERWTYWEKFDYMAEVGGSAIIGITGLFLWFPVFFSAYIPGWMFNAASMVHGFEALLAVGFIFTIHFFNAHLRLEKFPVDDVMFTGRLPEEEFKHERAAEYERIVKSGEIAGLRTNAPPPSYRRFSVVMGIVAMIVGTTIVILIIAAALKWI